MNLNLLLVKFGLPLSFAQDFTLILIVVLVSFIFGAFVGRYRLITILINIYISLALLAAVPGGYLKDYSYQLAFFFAAVIIFTILGKKLFEISISGSGSGFLWRVFAMSFLEVMLLVSIAVSIAPKKIALGYVSVSTYQYLASPNAQFLWLLAPLIFVFIIHKKLNR